MEFKKYFELEKLESVVFFLVGTTSLVFLIIQLMSKKSDLLLGLAISAAFIGVVQLTIGAVVFFRSPKDTARVEKMIGTSQIQQTEIPRMKVVMKNFVVYRYVEIAFVIVGIALLIICKNTFWQGLGWGLILQGSISLFLDYFAESRGNKYLEWLENL